jgi:hypothetical protein
LRRRRIAGNKRASVVDADHPAAGNNLPAVAA